jgi:hypothetical protein
MRNNEWTTVILTYIEASEIKYNQYCRRFAVDFSSHDSYRDSCRHILLDVSVSN